MTRIFQIVLPGLFDLPLHEIEPQLLRQELPYLNQILRWAAPKPNRAYTIDAILGSSLTGQDALPTASAGLPMAQAFNVFGSADPERLLLCQAIHLRPDMHSAVIVPIHEGHKNWEDIRLIIKDLSVEFNVDYDISEIAGRLFLLHLKQFEAPTCYPHILSVLGKIANPYIEQSKQYLPWYKLLNEIQMFMHQHPVNQRRVQHGLLAINSLWFWGGGHRRQVADTSLAWFCDDPLLNQFARSLGLTPRSCTEFGPTDKPGDALVIDLRLLETVKTDCSVHLGELLLDIEQKLLQPLLAMVRTGRAQIVLRAGYEYDFTLKWPNMMKFWRPHKNLSDWLAIGNDP